MFSGRNFWVGLLALVGFTPAFAQTITWGNTGADFAAAGSWSGGTAPGAGNIAAFGGAVTVAPSLGTATTVGGLLFNASTTLTGSATLTLGNSGIENIAGVVTSISAPIVFAGPTAAPIVNHGQLTLLGTVAVGSSLSLTVSGAGTTTIAGKLTGSGTATGLTKSGTGTLVLSSAHNDYAGLTTVSGGALVLSGSGVLGASSLGTTVSSGATLHLNNVYTSEPLTLTGAGSNYSGIAGALTAVGFSSVSGAVTLAGDTTIGVIAGSDLVVSGAIGQSGGARVLTKTGFGTLTLAGENTYTGGTVVHAGELHAFNDNAIPANSALTIHALNGPAQVELVGNQTLGSITFGGSGASANALNRLVLQSGAQTLSGSITLIAASNPATAGLLGGTLTLSATPGPATASGLHEINVGDSPTTPIDLQVSSILAGDGGLIKTGGGTLWLAGNNTFTGGLTVQSGVVLLGENASAGISSTSAPKSLRIESGAAVAAGPILGGGEGEDLRVITPLNLASGAILGSSLFDSRSLTFAGDITVAGGATNIRLAGTEPVFFEGALGAPAGGSTALSFDSNDRQSGGVVILSGTTSASVSSIAANKVAVVFASNSAIPAAVTVSDGYLGVGVRAGSTAPSAATLLARLPSDPSTRAALVGAIGFDTDDTFGRAFTFTDALNLSGFGPGLTLGSLSRAIISGPITPAASGYNFGNGGGYLFVDSALTGAHAVNVVSAPLPDNALTVIFRGNNTFTGDLTVAGSRVIIDSLSALPVNRKVVLGPSSYLGFSDLHFGRETLTTSAGSTSLPSFAERVAAHLKPGYAPTAVVGLDSHDFFEGIANSDGPGSTHFTTQTIDLSGFGPIYFGTASDVTLFGTIRAPNQSAAARTLSLAPTRDASLFIASPLLAHNVNRVVVGLPDPQLGHGRLILSGDSTYAGGTTLLGGELALLSSSAFIGRIDAFGPLGSGPLTVPSGAHEPALTAYAYSGFRLQNDISLGANTLLRLGSFSLEDDDSAGLSALSSTFFGYGFSLDGLISGSGALAVHSDVALTRNNTFTGGVTLQQGELHLGHDNALGTGTLRIQPIASRDVWDSGVALRTGREARLISNPVTFTPGPDTQLSFLGRGALTLSGAISLQSQSQLNVFLPSLTLSGPISGPGSLRINGDRPVFLSGTNTYQGGTVANQGTVVFNNSSSLPASPGPSLTTQGYIGIGYVPASLQTDFINRFNKGASYGALGFDSPTGGTNTFNGSIDLTGFDTSIRLGSATRAVLTGAITPAGNAYRFGDGGGFLQVNSSLVDGASPRSLVVWSDSDLPLTLRLTGTNSTTGKIGTNAVSVTSSALIFAPGAQPTSGSYSIEDSGYIGTEDAANAQPFIGRFNPNLLSGVIGFDAGISVAAPLDFSALSANPNIFYLGSATSATLSGALTLPTGATAYRFAGYKGGQLTVSSVLGGGRGVVIGDEDVPAFHGDPSQNFALPSTVTLTAANTYSGDTELRSGRLLVGNNAALGTGTLRVAPSSDYLEMLPEMPVFGPSVAGLNIPNRIALGSTLSGETQLLTSDYANYGSLRIDTAHAFTLSGQISGEGGLHKSGSGTLTLLGSNTFEGGLYVAAGQVVVGHANALGTGPLSFGTAAGPSVTFNQDTTIYGLSGDHLNQSINVASGKTLTIAQPEPSSFAGKFEFAGATLTFRGPQYTAGTAAFVSDDAVPLRLTGASSSTGNVTISSGVNVIAGHSQALGTGAPTAPVAVTLNGGTLTVESGVTLAHAFTLNSGTLAGVGTIQPAATARIGNNMTLAPGGSGVGKLTFQQSSLSITPLLSLESGGSYTWQLADALAGTADLIDVKGTVAVAATAGAPFTFTILGAGPIGLLDSIANYDPTRAYSWTLMTATDFTGFNAAALVAEPYSSQLIGTFNFSLNHTTPGVVALQLNFTPAAVPEPSTFALLGLGALVVFASRRRRRR